MNIQRILARISGTALLLLVAFTGGVSYHDFSRVHDAHSFKTALSLLPSRLQSAVFVAARGEDSQYPPQQVYEDVLTTLRSNYYGRTIDPTTMTYNAIRGMMGSLNDRYTRFMDPKDYKEMTDDDIHGTFAGIGALLSTNAQNQIFIVRPLPNTPAFKAKVMAGDIILKIDKKSTLNMKIDDALKLIHGDPDTKVTLTLLRQSAKAPVVITIVRDIVQQEVVQDSMIDPVNKIGYISLSIFNEDSDVQIEKALNDMQAKGARGIILDLRENPGGLLDVAQRVASRFVAGGPIVWIKDRTGPIQSINVIQSLHDNHLHFPLVVLVNGDSASSSEIVSGAIKDTGSGEIVGEKTFGKGLVQTIIPIRDGSAVAITTQHYFTAKMHDINHKGIEPDVTVKYTDADTRKNFEYLRKHPEAYYDLNDDPQLQKAVSELKAKMRVASARPWQ